MCFVIQAEGDHEGNMSGFTLTVAISYFRMASISPCAACKIQGKECTQECIFAPHFPLENLQRFECVNNVFGVSNIADILNAVDVSRRKEAVKTLVYEAELRMQDPIYGCVGQIISLQKMITELNINIYYAKKKLATYHELEAMSRNYLSPLSSSMMDFQGHGQQQILDIQDEYEEMDWMAPDDDGCDENKMG
ncbi:hypothetical protein RIF29_27735 [Crotalaria pallida]|uniref:LOB domain-containing protein n=1 Tax=Crotalaria pallida TaxID=3830 RepID=A0AAN9ERT1_CROPI